MIYSSSIDQKWQKKWNKTNLHHFNRKREDKKLYCLEMFTYPSGAKLHVGHWFNFGPSDSWARMKRMQGYEIFQPMGFDAFGLPAENYAIKTGIHPQDSTLANIETMEKQLQGIGGIYDWNYEVITCMPDFYKWTQWIFLQLYKRGVAYRKEAPVNWCPNCKTVLANEQVISGECERCSGEVTKKNLTQWFLKITAYADELLEKLDGLDWPEKTKKIQKNWIGRSTGTKVIFQINGTDKTLQVFTTRVDTIYGVTFIVIAPEHELINSIVSKECHQSVEEYQEMVKKYNEIERLSTERELTGVFSGSYAIHPLSGEPIPIWIGDYVLASYGTGCVMGVPAHSEHDYCFAQKYNLPIKKVVGGNQDKLPFTEEGTLSNSQEFDNMSTIEARNKILERLEREMAGCLSVNYRLRDWLVSRQRYWGTPIPIVYCDQCGIVPVPEEDLPVLLPYNVEFTPDGESPLQKCEEFINTRCPLCGGTARREADTLDTFVDSSWYYLRYPDNKNNKNAFNTEWINKMLPVDKYIGGAEHATMHLLYARFFTKVLRDMGYLNFDEPFISLVHQGIILGPDGNRMSKSKGNTISPDEYVSKYGSDVFRMYLMFGFSYTDGGPWSDDSIKAVSRFVRRIERFVEKFLSTIKNSTSKNEIGHLEHELKRQIHISIKGVTEDAERFQFNTVISRLMELCNALYKYDGEAETKNVPFLEESLQVFILLLAPFAPHLAEELWENLGQSYSVFNQPWPTWNENDIFKDNIDIAIQINGVIRCVVNISSSLNTDEIEKIALKAERVKSYLDGKEIEKVIVVPKRLVNIVAK